MVEVIKLFCFVFIVAISGCVNQVGESTESEKALLSIGDYNKLIDIYRDKLVRTDNREDRYKLSLYYNKAGDFHSSSYYLKQIINGSPNSKECYLDAINLNELNQYEETLKRLDCAVSVEPIVNDAYNLYGIVYAENGEYELAKEYLNKARDKFVNEVKVVNNLAMVAILEEDYSLAKSYLLPLLSRGVLDEKGLYNLAFSYVKLKDTKMAYKTLEFTSMDEDEITRAVSDMQFIKPKGHE